jgi:hypothetical protein
LLVGLAGTSPQT